MLGITLGLFNLFGPSRNSNMSRHTQVHTEKSLIISHLSDNKFPNSHWRVQDSLVATIWPTDISSHKNPRLCLLYWCYTVTLSSDLPMVLEKVSKKKKKKSVKRKCSLKGQHSTAAAFCPFSDLTLGWNKYLSPGFGLCEIPLGSETEPDCDHQYTQQAWEEES